MPGERQRQSFMTTRNQETWIVEADVMSVTPLTTRQDGRKCLLLKMQGPEGQPEIWIEDSPDARRKLNMRGPGAVDDAGAADEPPPPENEGMGSDYRPFGFARNRDRNRGPKEQFPADLDDEIPF